MLGRQQKYRVDAAKNPPNASHPRRKHSSRDVTTRRELDRLLARGRLSGPDRDRILSEVQRRTLRHTSPTKYLLIAGPLALAAGLAFLIRPSGLTPSYAAKGGATDAPVEVGCSDGELAACPRGSKLIFRFNALGRAAYLHAFAEPTGEPRQRVWYFPTSASAAPHVAPAVEQQALAKGIVIGPEHGIGSYRVHVVLSTRPLGRDELLLATPPDVVSTQIVDLTVVER